MKKTMIERGFTLIEIMVSMVISSLVVAGIYGVYTIQQRSYTTQEKVTEIQQRLRSAMDFISRDIRMAGYDPDNACQIPDDQALLTVAPDRFRFQYCERSGTAWVRNSITYSLNDEGQLRRNLTQSGTGQTRVLADGIDGIEFRYLQGDGQTVTTTANAVRVVRLSILARATYPDPKYTDRLLHLPASGSSNATWSGQFDPNPANDNFHRRLLITSIELRNVGL
ncbi:MAG: prepilin-type N-terminal cleavage/methylation domain-containing protein [Candidatus Electronema sp. VV]